MIGNTFNSFKENINQKLKNPFLGTFIIIWIIRNWKFVYSLFYFDSDLNLDNRIEKIALFFKEYGILEILITIGLTFLVLIATYSLLNISRLIINFFDKIVSPKVYEITDKSSIVLKSEYDNIKNEIGLLESKVQDERESRLKIQKENEELENRIKELLSSTENVDSVDNSNVKKTKSTSGTLTGKSSKSNLLYQKLKKEKQIENFDQIAGLVLNNKTLSSDSELISEFTRLGLIKQKQYISGENNYKYDLTTDGKNIHDRIVVEN